TTEAQVAKALEDAYRDAAFVRLTGAALPEIKHVAHTNFCDIGWKVDEGRNWPGGAEPQHRSRPRRTDGPAVTRTTRRRVQKDPGDTRQPQKDPADTRRAQRRQDPAIVLKLGGELLEQPDDLARIATGIAALAQRTSLVVVHGGGREIDSALATAGIAKQQVDGLRVTDARTLDVVVAVLAGAINTRLVAALRKAGARPVGLTGA